MRPRTESKASRGGASTFQQKIEIVLAGLPGDRSVKEVCRERAVSETVWVSERVARSGELVAEGHSRSVVARTLDDARRGIRG
jgi:hypothetical protein